MEKENQWACGVGDEPGGRGLPRRIRSLRGFTDYPGGARLSGRVSVLRGGWEARKTKTRAGRGIQPGHSCCAVENIAQRHEQQAKSANHKPFAAGDFPGSGIALNHC
ncbi:hypothetical protein PV04_07557 [Phialophora macrospora]|uniref:Uncharacterized protein n=1 Tax=Phialophora macrospora TaxID=1851006 RepID=A0A0D2CJ62_9EURO|nr:hypothetical protein PV04_07557 [Phialophora macrospora]